MFCFQKFHVSPQDAARALLPILGSRLIDVPYIIVGHSVGTWLAYEFVRAAQDAGLPAPVKAFLSNFPVPDLPVRVFLFEFIFVQVRAIGVLTSCLCDRLTNGRGARTAV